MKTSFDKIFEKIGFAISDSNLYGLITGDEVLNEYDKLYSTFKDKDTETCMEEMKEFINSHMSNIDKDKLVLLTLFNHITEYDKFDETERFFIMNYIYEAKKMLDGKSVRIYKHRVDEKTGLARTEKLTSEEMNAFPMAEKYSDSEKIKISYTNSKEELKKDLTEKFRIQTLRMEQDKKRQEIFNKQKASKEKKRISNMEKINKLEEENLWDEIVAYLRITDFGDTIFNEEELGDVVVYEAYRNSVILNSNYNFDQELLKQLILDEKLEDYALDNVSDENFDKVISDTLKRNADEINIDKILLTVATRIYQILEMHEDASEVPEYSEEERKDKIEELAYCRNLLISIYEHLDNKTNTRLIGTLEFERNKFVQIRFDKEGVKEILDTKFVTPEIYMSKNYTNNVMEKLKTGQKNVAQYPKEVIRRLNLKVDEWRKIFSLSSENFETFLKEIKFIENSEDNLKVILDKVEKINNTSIKILIDENFINDEEIIDICLKNKINLVQLINYSKDTGKNIDELIINCFEKLKEDNKEELLFKNELVEFFNYEKIKDMAQKQKIDEKFLEFYSEILPKNEDEKNEILSNTKNIFANLFDTKLIKKAYELNLLGIDEIVGKLNEYEAMELVEENLVEAIKFKEKGLISEESLGVIIETTEADEFLHLLDNGEIDLEEGIKHITEEKIEIFDKYTNNEFKSPIPALWGYTNGNLSIDELEQLFNKGLVKEEDIFENALKGIFRASEIRQIYLKTLISEEELDKLKDRNIISQSLAQTIKESLSMQNIADGLKITGLGINMNGQELQLDRQEIILEDVYIELPMQKQNSYGGGGNSFDDVTHLPEVKSVINPDARELKFETLGAIKIDRSQVEYEEENPFNDYDFFIIPMQTGEINPECIVIAERLYKDRFNDEKELISGNATYLFKLKDLTRIGKKSKPEIRREMEELNDRTMQRVFHTKNWAKNIDKKIAQIQKKQMQSVYTKEELKKINTLNELIDGFKEKDGTLSRMFDVPEKEY